MKDITEDEILPEINPEDSKKIVHVGYNNLGTGESNNLSTSLEDLVSKFENTDPEMQEMISKQLEIDKKKLMLDTYVRQLQEEGMSSRYIRRAMERKATQLGLNKI